MRIQVMKIINQIKKYGPAIGLAFGSGVAAHAADYSDVAAATAAVSGIPTTVSPVFLAFVTLAVGALTIRMVARMAKKGASVA